MLRAEKAQVIDDLNEVFTKTGVVVVTHYKGLTVAEITDLRGADPGGRGVVPGDQEQAGAAGGGRHAVRAMAPLFKGPTAIAFSKDPTAAPQIVSEFGKKNEKLQIVGGGLSGTLLDAASVQALAELPSLDELRGKLMGLLNTPASRLVGLLQAPGGQIARVSGGAGGASEALEAAAKS